MNLSVGEAVVGPEWQDAGPCRPWATGECERRDSKSGVGMSTRESGFGRRSRPLFVRCQGSALCLVGEPRQRASLSPVRPVLDSRTMDGASTIGKSKVKLEEEVQHKINQRRKNRSGTVGQPRNARILGRANWDGAGVKILQEKKISVPQAAGGAALGEVRPKF